MAASGADCHEQTGAHYQPQTAQQAMMLELAVSLFLTGQGLWSLVLGGEKLSREHACEAARPSHIQHIAAST